VAWAEAAAEAERSEVIVNATSIGLSGHGDGVVPAAPRRGQIAVDFVYGDTEFARAARSAGSTLVSGEDILVRQGALAFTLFTGRPAPEAVMARALGGQPQVP
jgi:shikimate dehydrogenase